MKKKITFNFKKYFVTNLKVSGGETVIRGTRVTLKTILASLTEGNSVDEILAEFPSLKKDDVKAAIAFAAAAASEDFPISETPRF